MEQVQSVPCNLPSQALMLVADKIANKEMRNEFTVYGKYVCLGIDALYRRDYITLDCALAVKNHIDTLLGNSATLNNWLRKRLSKEEVESFQYEMLSNSDTYRSYKLAWVLDMAEYFKSQGK